MSIRNVARILQALKERLKQSSLKKDIQQFLKLCTIKGGIQIFKIWNHSEIQSQTVFCFTGAPSTPSCVTTAPQESPEDTQI